MIVNFFNIQFAKLLSKLIFDKKNKTNMIEAKYLRKDLKDITYCGII